MKKLSILFTSILILCTTGCLKRDNLEDINIYTTVYPIEYITERLYGEHSTIHSIYPNETDLENYELTDKQISDYSKGNMYIFNGLSNEKDYVAPMFQHNKNLMIIDTTLSMELNYQIEELWLDPSNFLMLSLNIKNGLSEYISNHYLKEEIEKNYDALKIEISNIDAKLKLLSESTNYKTIVTDNNVLKFLEKYGFTVISLEDDITEKTINDVKGLIQNRIVQYLFTFNPDQLSDSVSAFVAETGVQLIELHSLSNLTEKESSEKEDYISLYNENIEQLKKEIYH